MGYSLLAPIFKDYFAIAPYPTNKQIHGPWHFCHGPGGFPSNQRAYKALCGAIQGRVGTKGLAWNGATDYLIGKSVCETCIYLIIEAEA